MTDDATLKHFVTPLVDRIAEAIVSVVTAPIRAVDDAQDAWEDNDADPAA